MRWRDAPRRRGLVLTVFVWAPILLLLLLDGCDAQLKKVDPLLRMMYLKYRDSPIDTTPFFNPTVFAYTATMDWKMKYFQMMAVPVAPGIIDNVHLCPQNADCLTQDQRVATMDFEKPILVRPGEKVLFMFDVLLAGMVKTYSVVVNRLEGLETTLADIVIHGATLYPTFAPAVPTYQVSLDVHYEFAHIELHVVDGGQNLFATAEEPLALQPTDNITYLKNDNPGVTAAPPTRRRLTELAFGEFQYPVKPLHFPVPLTSKRLIDIKVTSADGGHFGYYSVTVARKGCHKTLPFYDAQRLECVKFCNTGYYQDIDSGQCKACQESCVNCLSYDNCVQCADETRLFKYVLANATGSCNAIKKPFYMQHPQETLALGSATVALCVFLTGLYSFRVVNARSMRPSAQDSMMMKALRKRTDESRRAASRSPAYALADEFDVY